MPEKNKNTGGTLKACFEEVIRMAAFTATVDGFFSDLPGEKTAASLDFCRDTAEKLLLSPEMRTDADADELAAFFGSPVFLLLNNGNWVLYLGIRNQLENGKQEERFAVFDPLSKSAGKILLIGRESLGRVWGGNAVFVKINSGSFSSDGRHTSLYCLTAIVKHHGGDASVSRMLHNYAVSEDEPKERMIGKIASDLDFSFRKIRLKKWRDLSGIGAAFPVMVRKKDGRYAVLCGVRPVAPSGTTSLAIGGASVEPADGSEAPREEKTTVEVPPETAAGPEKSEPEIAAVIWDPFVADGKKPEVKDVCEPEFFDAFDGSVFLFKRHFALSDENQPFGLRWFVPEFLKQKKLLFQVASAILAVSLISLAVPVFFQLVVDKVLMHESYSTLKVLVVLVSVMLVFNALLGFLERYFLLYATNRIDIRLAMKTFAKLLSLPVDFYERISSGVLIKHMQQTEKIRSFLSGSLFFTALELLSLVIFLPFLLVYSVKLTLIVLGFTLLMALVIAVLIKPFQTRLEELYLAEGKRQGMLVETIHGIRTVKSLAIEPVQQKKWNDTVAYAITRSFRVAQISITAQTLCELLEKLMFVAIICVGALSVFDGVLTVGALIAFQMLSGRVTGPLVKIVGLVHEYQQTALSVKMLGVVMNCSGEQVGGSLHHRIRGEISVENVSFRYSPTGPAVIRDFNLHIQPGTTIGLVGRSGSGKTTLTKLIQGLYPLQSGIIKYDGIDIREIDRASLRSNIGVVLQDNYFFQGTVRENISVTRKEASMEEIIYASRLAGADEFVQKLPRGYDSMLEENASNLSGGQRQRLAIARALLPNPRLLIFDEATSALDPESETLIRHNLKMIARNRTVFIISHRLSVLCRADNIVVMDKGELVESGTHRSLLEKNGIYANFWKQQMGTDDE